MIGRRPAALLALALGLLVALAVLAEGARGDSRSRELQAQRVVNAISDAFGGPGPLAACFWQVAWRESRLRPREANRTDPYGGSYGALQVNGVWRRRGETVDHFARRMFDPVQNARLARRIYELRGLQPWGGSCS